MISNFNAEYSVILHLFSSFGASLLVIVDWMIAVNGKTLVVNTKNAQFIRIPFMYRMKFEDFKSKLDRNEKQEIEIYATRIALIAMLKCGNLNERLKQIMKRKAHSIPPEINHECNLHIPHAYLKALKMNLTRRKLNDEIFPLRWRKNENQNEAPT